MKILITGTPGTGKTTFSSALSKELNLPHHEISKIIIEKNYGTKREDHTVFNHKQLKKKFKNLVGIIDTHCNEIVSDPDIVILMKCSIEELKKEYLRRKYNSEKIRQNIEYEIFDEGAELFNVDLIFYREKVKIEEMVQKTKELINQKGLGVLSNKKEEEFNEKMETEEILNEKEELDQILNQIAQKKTTNI